MLNIFYSITIWFGIKFPVVFPDLAAAELHYRGLCCSLNPLCLPGDDSFQGSGTDAASACGSLKTYPGGLYFF